MEEMREAAPWRVEEIETEARDRKCNGTCLHPTLFVGCEEMGVAVHETMSLAEVVSYFAQVNSGESCVKGINEGRVFGPA